MSRRQSYYLRLAVLLALPCLAVWLVFQINSGALDVNVGALLISGTFVLWLIIRLAIDIPAVAALAGLLRVPGKLLGRSILGTPRLVEPPRPPAFTLTRAWLTRVALALIALLGLIELMRFLLSLRR
jgi:hypothetical protein